MKKACLRLIQQRGALSSLSSCDAGIELERWNKFSNRYQAHGSASDGKPFERMIFFQTGFELLNTHSGMLQVFSKLTIVKLVTLYSADNGENQAIENISRSKT